MAGIDFRQKDALLQQYEDYGKPNFGIYSGKRLKICYEGGDIAEGSRMLSDYLDQIERSGTAQQFDLLVYPESIKNVTNQSGYAGSFSFMLNSDIPVKQINGVTFIDREAKQANYRENSAINSRLEQLEAENKRLQSMLIDAKIGEISQAFEAKIAGLQNATPPPPSMEQNIMGMIDKVVEKPEVIGHLFDGLARLIDKFKGTTTPAPQPAPAISGDVKYNHQNNEDMAEKTPFILPEVAPLTDEERANGWDMETKQSIESIYQSIDEIAAKIGYLKLAKALHNISEMGEMQLKGFILMM